MVVWEPDRLVLVRDGLVGSYVASVICGPQLARPREDLFDGLKADAEGGCKGTLANARAEAAQALARFQDGDGLEVAMEEGLEGILELAVELLSSVVLL